MVTKAVYGRVTACVIALWFSVHHERSVSGMGPHTVPVSYPAFGVVPDILAAAQGLGSGTTHSGP